MDEFEITDAHGGESLLRHALAAGDLVVADRGYAHRTGLGSLLAGGAQLVVRINGHNLPLETAAGERDSVAAAAKNGPMRRIGLEGSRQAGRARRRACPVKLLRTCLRACRRPIKRAAALSTARVRDARSGEAGGPHRELHERNFLSALKTSLREQGA